MQNYPKVGIRPIIDGRRMGVRESLEEKTMFMAKQAAKLISSSLRYPDGTPVQCVISDTTIGGVAEAARCAEKFKRENVGVSLSVTPCWCYGSETIDMDTETPKAIWGFNGTERPGAVYLAAALAAHSQKGLPAFGIYGRDVMDMDDSQMPDDAREKILLFVKSALAAAMMKGKSYLSIGSVAMGIAGSIVNSDFFEKYLGMRCEYSDMSEIIRRVDKDIYDHEEYERAIQWARKNCRIGEDSNPSHLKQGPEKQQEILVYCVKMAIIARDMMLGNPKLAKMGYVEESEGRNAIAGGFQGQRQWTDFMPNGDFMEAILNSSFDWNGTKEPLILATENDSLNGVAMLFGKLVTNTASVFADVRTYWSPKAIERVSGWKPDGLAANGVIHLKNSGAAALDSCGLAKKGDQPVMKPFWELTDEEVDACLKATTWNPANLEYFRGGGLSSQVCTNVVMPVTMVRVNLVAGLGPVLQLVEGYTVPLPEKVDRIINARTDDPWPSAFFAPILTGTGAFTDVYSVMNQWGANHGSFNYGHIGAELITLCSILRIPVCMHNVQRSRIFRPSAWNSFGTENLESADILACKNFGPLY